MPDGTTRDLLDVLCQLSRAHRIDWEISHDHSGGPVGYIRGGVCERAVLAQLEAIADLTDLLEGPLDDPGIQQGASGDAPGAGEEAGDGDEDDDPPILPFRPNGK